MEWGNSGQNGEEVQVSCPGPIYCNSRVFWSWKEREGVWIVWGWGATEILNWLGDENEAITLYPQAYPLDQDWTKINTRDKNKLMLARISLKPKRFKTNFYPPKWQNYNFRTKNNPLDWLTFLQSSIILCRSFKCFSHLVKTWYTWQWASSCQEKMLNGDRPFVTAFLWSCTVC